MNSNQELINDLKQFVAFLESRPELPCVQQEAYFCAFIGEKKEFAEAAKMMGSTEKRSNCDYFHLDRFFGKSVHVSIFADHAEVCERIVTKKLLPAEPEIVVPETVIAAKPEREIEVVEWRCPESILSLASAGSFHDAAELTAENLPH